MPYQVLGYKAYYIEILDPCFADNISAEPIVYALSTDVPITGDYAF